MKRIIALFLLFAFCVNLTACATASDFYGVWYVDDGEVRNAIQFSENGEGKDVFVWAVYNVKDDSIVSNTTGYYRISGDSIVFDPGDKTELFELQYEIDGDTLVIFNDAASLTLEKYELNN